MKKRGILNIILLFSVFILVGLYVLMGFYYKGSFSYGTWINNVYCTGKSVAQVNDELKSSDTYNGIIVTSKDDQHFIVTAESIGFEEDYKDELQKIIDSQNPLAWGINFFTSRNREIIGDIKFNEDLVKERLSEWNIFETKNDKLYEIKRDDEGYYLVDNITDEPDFEKFYSKTIEALKKRAYEIDLGDDPECYVKAKPSESDLEIKDLFEEVNSVQDRSVKLELLNESFYVTKKDISEWMLTIDQLGNAFGPDKADDSASKTDTTVDTKEKEAKNKEKEPEKNPGDGKYIAGNKLISFPNNYEVHGNFITDSDGNILLSCEKIFDFIDSKSKELNTLSCIKRYQKENKGEIIVSGSKDGKLFDPAKEYTKLVESLAGDGSDISIDVPNKSFVIDGTELGDEYILVDMGNQHLSYFKNGKLNIEYDVVTGNTKLGRGTPVGLFHVYNKRYHTILRGVDYASYVNYWLGVNKGIGIHDATWRSKFGGEIYKGAGSHGCINSPLELMEKLYNTVEVGVPVLLFY